MANSHLNHLHSYIVHQCHRNRLDDHRRFIVLDFDLWHLWHAKQTSGAGRSKNSWLMTMIFMDHGRSGHGHLACDCLVDLAPFGSLPFERSVWSVFAGPSGKSSASAGHFRWSRQRRTEMWTCRKTSHLSALIYEVNSV